MKIPAENNPCDKKDVYPYTRKRHPKLPSIIPVVLKKSLKTSLAGRLALGSLLVNSSSTL